MEYIPPPPTIPPGSAIFAYLRDSGGDSQEKSVTQQETIIREYCHRHGLILVRIFSDAARSGGSVEKRESFLAMIDATKSTEDRPAGILVWNLARFSRDVDDSDYYKSTLRLRGIVIHSLTDQIPAGLYAPVIEKLIDVSNEEYRRQNSDAVKRALRDLVRQGYAPGGATPPKGYIAQIETTGTKRDGRPRTASRWIPDPALAPLVQLAFKMRADGKSYREIIRATGGKLYTAVNAWPTFFSNRSYLGIGKCGSDEFENHHEPLIDRITFDAVQAYYKLHPRSGLDNPKRIAYPSLLSGLSYCVRCGAAMVYHAHRNRDWPFYICSKRDRHRLKRECDTRRIDARKADRIVFETVMTRILTPTYFEELIEETRTALSDTESIDQAIREKQDDMRNAKQAMDNLLDMVETFGPGAAQERYQKREAEVTRLKYEIQELQARRGALEVEITPEALALALREWQDQLTQTQERGEVANLRLMLAMFVSRIDLDYQTAKIWYTFPLDGFIPSSALTSHGGTSL